MALEQDTNVVTADTNRKVWVVSSLQVPAGDNPDEYIYKEKFRGKWIEIPAMEEKKVMMPLPAAKRFLSQVRPPASPNPDGTYRNDNGVVDSERFGKPLRIIEMTDQEKFDLLGITTEEQARVNLEIAQELTEKDHKGNKSDAIPVGKGKPQAHKMRKSAPQVDLDKLGLDR